MDKIGRGVIDPHANTWGLHIDVGHQWYNFASGDKVVVIPEAEYERLRDLAFRYESVSK